MSAPGREVNVRFQIRWIVGIAVINILSSLVFLSVLRSVLTQELSSNYSLSFHTLRNAQRFLVPAIGFSVLFYVILVSILVALITLFISHSIAGPLFRLEMLVECVRRGELNFSTRLRQGDQISGLAQAMGDLRDSFVGELQPVGQALEKIDTIWNELDEPSSDGRTDEVFSRIEAELTAIANGLGV